MNQVAPQAAATFGAARYPERGRCDNPQGFVHWDLDDFLEKNLSQVNDHVFFLPQELGAGSTQK